MSDTKDNTESNDHTEDADVPKPEPAKVALEGQPRSGLLGIVSSFTLAIVFGVALVSVDYWRAGATAMLSDIIGDAPNSVISIDEIITLQLQMQDLVTQNQAQQESIQQQISVFDQQSIQDQTQIKTFAASDSAQSAQMKQLGQVLANIQGRLAAQQTMLETVQQWQADAQAGILSTSPQPKADSAPQGATISQETQDFLTRMNVALGKAEGDIQRLMDSQDATGQQIARLTYFVHSNRRFHDLLAMVERAQPFADVLRAFQLTLNEEHQQQLAEPLAVLGKHAGLGVVESQAWAGQVSAALAQQVTSILSVDTSGDGVLDQVLSEIRGLVKISKIQKDNSIPLLSTELVTALEKRAIESNDPIYRTLLQQWQAKITVQVALKQLAVWLDTIHDD